MKVFPKSCLKLDGFEKCELLADYDCPLGQLYDYACALKGFLIEKIQEAELREKPQECQNDSHVEE